MWRMTIKVHGSSFDAMKNAAESVLGRVRGAKSYRDMPISSEASLGDGGPRMGWSCEYTCPDEDRIAQLRQEADRLEAGLRGKSDS